jgi:hypothetical protein
VSLLQTILLAYQQPEELSFYNLTSIIWAAQRQAACLSCFRGVLASAGYFDTVSEGRTVSAGFP